MQVKLAPKASFLTALIDPNYIANYRSPGETDFIFVFFMENKLGYVIMPKNLRTFFLIPDQV